MTFRQFITRMVLVRDDATGSLRLPVLHAEEERIVDAMDTIDTTTGLRRYLTIIASWPRKAGKTWIAAVIGVYMLVFDSVHREGREVIVQASSKDQGQSAVFKAMRRLVRANPWLEARIKITTDGMLYVDEAGIEHTVKVLPNSPGAVHGLNGSCVIYDEAWVHPNWDALEGTSPSPARRCPLTVWASYSGLKSQRTPDNPWYSVLTRAQAGDDPTTFLSHMSGREAALRVPWITPAWLARLEAQFAHIRSKYLRLGLNQWSTSDTGAFLTEEEIRDALDPELPIVASLGPRAPSARIGVDLGLVKDRTAIVATDLDPTGRLVVRHVEILQGTRARPVSLIDVEARIANVARELGTKDVSLDRWQSAQMGEGLRRRGLSVRSVTCDAAWLDRAATHVKHWFSQRHIRIPSHAGLLEELEGLEAEELRRRDRVRFTATGSNHDDACVALCLSAEHFAGGVRPDRSQVGRAKLPEIDNCVALNALGRDTCLCPIAGEITSAQPGCRRCAMFMHAATQYEAHVKVHPWIPLANFVEARFQPNAWLRARRFSGAMDRLGI